MSFAKSVFSASPLSSKEFEGLIKQWLFLNNEQNDALTKQLQMEDMLGRFSQAPRFKSIFKQKDVYTKVDIKVVIYVYLFFIRFLKISDWPTALSC